METKERNTGKEKSMEQEELLNKREFLSDEALKEVAGGDEQYDDTDLSRCNCDHPGGGGPACISLCCETREDCPRLDWP